VTILCTQCCNNHNFLLFTTNKKERQTVRHEAWLVVKFLNGLLGLFFCLVSDLSELGHGLLG
jgi:hypothetical protein